LSGSVGQPTTCSGGPVTPCIPINISLNTSGLAIGNYSEYLTLNDPNAIDAPQIITVSVQVNGSPASVDFYVTPGNAASLIVNTGSTVLSTVTTSDKGSWLNFVLVGNHVIYTSYQLRVTAQPTQGEGTYSGTVILSGSTNPADNKNMTVNMHVTSQPIIELPASPTTFNLVQGQSAQTLTVALQNLGLGSLNVSGTTASGGNWLNASPAGGGKVSITADPGSLSPGSYNGTVALTSNAANTAVQIPVRVIVTAASGPVVAFNGVVDNAAFVNGQAVAAGSIAAVFGGQLSTSGPVNASGFPLPISLGGVQVLVNGVPAPIFYADAGQVDIQVPFGLSAAQVLVQVTRNGQPSNRVSTTVDSIAPRLFALRQLPAAPDGTPYGAVYNSDSTLALPPNLAGASHPAHPGDVVSIYALGLGPVTPSVATGAQAPSTEPLARATNAVQVMYGGGTSGSVSATASYAGLAPFFAGLYQINVLIPQGVPTGNVPVTISMPGHLSNVVEMAIATQ
jgi:uncharacterized protein (TIGR03437 family)